MTGPAIAPTDAAQAPGICSRAADFRRAAGAFAVERKPSTAGK
jgi:hypothetical protein